MSKETIEELSARKAAERIRAYNAGKKMRGIRLRKFAHFIIAAFLKIDQLQSKEKIEIIGDKRIPSKKPKIFACTHVGGNEIQRVLQVIKLPTYITLGDPGVLYRDPIYFGLWINGIISVETLNREDRKVMYCRSVELLKKGGNLLIFPEAAWNITPNLPVMKIFTGTVRMARETDSEIVPIALQQYGDTYRFNIGENYSIPNDTDKSVECLNNELRGKMAALAWEIIESAGTLDTKGLPPDCVERFQEDIFNRCDMNTGLSLQDVINERFHDKNITECAEAFAHLDGLAPCQSNAYLFNKRNHD